MKPAPRSGAPDLIMPPLPALMISLLRHARAQRGSPVRTPQPRKAPARGGRLGPGRVFTRSPSSRGVKARRHRARAHAVMAPEPSFKTRFWIYSFSDGFPSGYVIFQHCSQTSPNILKLQGPFFFFLLSVMMSYPYATDPAQPSPRPPPKKPELIICLQVTVSVLDLMHPKEAKV